jgi:uncharacterized protein affecting Mg2+/Co2+ transport
MSRPQFTVTVRPKYLSAQSAPSMGVFGFAYTVTITNTGDITAQLISRTWNINDANGVTEKVKGPGVIGEQPTLEPGESFEYTCARPPARCTANTTAWPTTARRLMQISRCLCSMRSAIWVAGRHCTDPH